MALLQNTYGKGRVRVLRLYRDGQYHEPRETSAKVLLEAILKVGSTLALTIPR